MLPDRCEPDDQSELDETVRYLHALVFDAKLEHPAPECFGRTQEARDLREALIQTREVLQCARYGRYDYRVTTKGMIGGLLKAIQSNLRHAAWSARCVAGGDLTQRIDYLGDFSEAFNLMTQRLAEMAARLQGEADRWRLALESSRDGVWDIDLIHPERSFYSRHFYDIVKFAPQSMPGSFRAWLKRVHPDDRRARPALEQFCFNRHQEDELQVVFRLRCGDGVYRWRAAKGRLFRDSIGRVIRVIGVLEDIHEQKEREEYFAYRAHHDPLTALPNREHFNCRLREFISRTHADQGRVAVVMIDLDGFKSINDDLGHHAGDLMLVEVARRLRACLGPEDVIARLGGDEFVALISCPGACDTNVHELIDALRVSLHAPVALESTIRHVTASFGVALFPCDAQTPLMLMKQADEALYQAKAGGRDAQIFWKHCGCGASTPGEAGGR